MSPFQTQPLRWSTTVGAVLVLLVLFAPRPLGGPTSYVMVAGSSMSPTFEDGDLVVVREGEYAVGDVVAFQTAGGVVIHRIIGGSEDRGFIVQGDNREVPDTWRPTPDEVLGKRLFHISGGGDRVLALMGDPMMLGGVLGGLGTLMMWKPRRRRKSRHGVHEATGSRRIVKAPPTARPTPRAGILLATLTGLALLLAGLLIYVHSQPLQRSTQLEVPRLQHTGSHRYVAAVDPSIVYDGTTITSDAAQGESTAIYTQLLNELHIEFTYEMSPRSPFDGEVALTSELQVGAGDNHWTRSLPLLPRQTFTGTTASESFTVDIPVLLSMIERAERETGHTRSAYDLGVLTRVHVSDETDDPVDALLEVELPMQLSDTSLSIDNTLSASEVVTTTEDQTVPNELQVAGLAMPVRDLRTVVAIALGALILAGVAYALVVSRRLGNGEAARIRLLYGPMIVPVSGMSPNGDHRVAVESIGDLVKLARRAEQLMFYDNEGGQTFSVPDGPVVYEYRVKQRRRRHR